MDDVCAYQDGSKSILGTLTLAIISTRPVRSAAVSREIKKKESVLRMWYLINKVGRTSVVSLF